jgi:hypothetical protein
MSRWYFSKARRICGNLSARPVFSSGIAALALLKDGTCRQGKSWFANYTTCPGLLAPRQRKERVEIKTAAGIIQRPVFVSAIF